MTKDEALQRMRKLRDDLDQCLAETYALADFFWVRGAEQRVLAAHSLIQVNVKEMEEEIANDCT